MCRRSVGFCGAPPPGAPPFQINLVDNGFSHVAICIWREIMLILSMESASAHPPPPEAPAHHGTDGDVRTRQRIGRFELPQRIQHCSGCFLCSTRAQLANARRRRAISSGAFHTKEAAYRANHFLSAAATASAAHTEAAADTRRRNRRIEALGATRVAGQGQRAQLGGEHLNDALGQCAIFACVSSTQPTLFQRAARRCGSNRRRRVLRE